MARAGGLPCVPCCDRQARATAYCCAAVPRRLTCCVVGSPRGCPSVRAGRRPLGAGPPCRSSSVALFDARRAVIARGDRRVYAARTAHCGQARDVLRRDAYQTRPAAATLAPTTVAET